VPCKGLAYVVSLGMSVWSLCFMLNELLHDREGIPRARQINKGAPPVEAHGTRTRGQRSFRRSEIACQSHLFPKSSLQTKGVPLRRASYQGVQPWLNSPKLVAEVLPVLHIMLPVWLHFALLSFQIVRQLLSQKPAPIKMHVVSSRATGQRGARVKASSAK
jgi:hypothetical protein